MTYAVNKKLPQADKLRARRQRKAIELRADALRRRADETDLYRRLREQRETEGSAFAQS